MRVALATTVLPGHDHVGPLERAQTEVTVVRRAADLAELLAVARSGLVDAVLIAAGSDVAGRGFLEELAATPRPVGVLALSEVRQDRERLRALGVPALPADVPPLVLAETVQQVARAAVEGVAPPVLAAEEPAGDAIPDSWAEAEGAACSVAGMPIELRVVSSGDDGLRGPHTADLEPLSAAAVDTTTGSISDEAAASPAPEPGTETGARSERLGSDGDAAGLPGERAGDAATSPPGSAAGARAAEVVVVWGPAGAPGRTTVAVNLAAEFALAGHRTLVVDLDTYGPSVGVHLGLAEEAAGVARAARRADRGPLTSEDVARAAVRLRVAGADLDVLTGLTRVDRWPELGGAAVTALLAAARGGWDRVVVDVGFCLEEDEEISFDIGAPQRNAATLASLAAADRVIAVGGADAVALPRLFRGLDALPSSLDRTRIRVVVNRVRPAAAGVSPAAQIEAVWSRYGPDLPLMARLPWDPSAADRALLSGQVLAEAAPGSALRQALAELARVHGTSIEPAGRRRRWPWRRRSAVIGRVRT